MHSKLTQAIAGRYQIGLHYKRGNRRVFWPHILYINSKGEKTLEGYQVSGYSEHPYTLPAWRQFEVKYISDLEILPKSFRIVDSIYNPSADRYKKVIRMV